MLKDQEVPVLHRGIVYVVLMLDELVHTDERPFCGDQRCPCHDDMEAFTELVEIPTLNGLMTTAEALQFYYGEQV